MRHHNLKIAITVLVVISWFVAALSGAEVQSPRDGNVKKAINILWSESVIAGKFADGSSGEPTELAWAFSAIVRERQDRVALFEELAKSGSYYGLLGLFVLDKEAFVAAKRSFLGNGKVVLVRGDTFEVLDQSEFVSTYIEKHGADLFQSLVFEEMPHWQDTVKLRTIPSIWLHEE